MDHAHYLILEHINHEAKHCIVSLLKEVHEFLPPEDDSLSEYLSISKEEIANRLELSKINPEILLLEKAAIDRLVMGNKHIDLMQPDMLHAMLSISKEISLLNLQMKNPSKHAERIVDSVAGILAAVLKWEDSAEEECAITGNHYLELLP